MEGKIEERKEQEVMGGRGGGRGEGVERGGRH